MDGKGDFGRRERQASPWSLPAGLPSEPENTFSPASQRSHASGSRTRVRGRVPLARRLPRARAYAHDWARDDARHAVRQSAAAPQGAPKSGQQDEVTGRSTAGSGRCKTLPMVATRSREELLAARLAISWAIGWRSAAACARRGVFYPAPLMANEHGDELRVVDVLSRLRCRHCGSQSRPLFFYPRLPVAGRSVAAAERRGCSPVDLGAHVRRSRRSHGAETGVHVRGTPAGSVASGSDSHHLAGAASPSAAGRSGAPLAGTSARPAASASPPRRSNPCSSGVGGGRTGGCRGRRR